MATIDKEKLDQLKQKHRDVWTFKRGEHQVAVRKPTSMEFRAYSMAVSADKKNFYDANETLLKACLLYPEGAAAEQFLEDWPGLIPDLGQEILLIAQLSDQTDGKKA